MTGAEKGDKLRDKLTIGDVIIGSTIVGIFIGGFIFEVLEGLDLFLKGSQVEWGLFGAILFSIVMYYISKWMERNYVLEIRGGL